MRLVERVEAAHARSSLLIELAPPIAHLPAPIQKYDDPFLPYSRAVISATAELAAGYIFDAAAYLALGAAGAIALERSVAVVEPEWITVLHGPFSRGVWAAFAGDGSLNADAATVTNVKTAAAFEAAGVGGLLTAAELSETLTITGVTFRVVPQAFLNQFTREDFADVLRRAIEGMHS